MLHDMLQVRTLPFTNSKVYRALTVDECIMSMQHWLNATDKEKQKFSQSNLSQYHFVRHKVLMTGVKSSPECNGDSEAINSHKLNHELLIKLNSAYGPWPLNGEKEAIAAGRCCRNVGLPVGLRHRFCEEWASICVFEVIIKMPLFEDYIYTYLETKIT
jgi:hypothetical protein